MADNPFRNLPAVNDILEMAALRVAPTYSHESIAEAVRQELADLRGLRKRRPRWPG